MIISTRFHVPFPRDLVFQTYRDRLEELIPYMPNIRGVVIKSREEAGDRIQQVNEWQGGGEIPSAARAILDDSMLSWTENAHWDALDFVTHWEIQTHAYREAVHCQGKNRFFATDHGTLVESSGELRIDPRQIHNVPGFVAKMVGGVVEDFLSKKIEPNLHQMGQSVQRYLEVNQT